MKKKFMICVPFIILFSSCRLFHWGSGRQEKNGCPMGRNIGAEKILSGDPKAIAAAKKANRFKKGMQLPQ